MGEVEKARGLEGVEDGAGGGELGAGSAVEEGGEVDHGDLEVVLGNASGDGGGGRVGGGGVAVEGGRRHCDVYEFGRGMSTLILTEVLLRS